MTNFFFNLFALKSKKTLGPVPLITNREGGWNLKLPFWRVLSPTVCCCFFSKWSAGEIFLGLASLTRLTPCTLQPLKAQFRGKGVLLYPGREGVGVAYPCCSDIVWLKKKLQYYKPQDYFTLSSTQFNLRIRFW